jgi:hypothetical protein
MSAKQFFSGALVLTVVGFGAARAQDPLAPRGGGTNGPTSSGGAAGGFNAPLFQGGSPGMTYTPQPGGGAPGAMYSAPYGGTPGAQYGAMPSSSAPDQGTSPAPAHGIPHLSDWITYTCSDCCGPVGGGPIRTELFVRSGISIPVAGKIFRHVLEDGWDIEAGGRTLFFNPEKTAAWAIDLGLTNINNHGQHSDIHIPLTVLVPNSTGTGATSVSFGSGGLPGVTVRELNRTYVNAGFGREWYMFGQDCGCGDCGDCGGGFRWRFGVDGGGRWGTARIKYHELPHRVDVIGGVYAAAHTDLEYSCGCCTFLTGFRLEWGYTWSDILRRGNIADVEDLNLMLTLGVRY